MSEVQNTENVSTENRSNTFNENADKAVGILSKFFSVVNIPLYYALFVLVAATTLVASVNASGGTAIMVCVGGIAILFIVMALLYKLANKEGKTIEQMSSGKIALYIIIPILITCVVAGIIIAGMIFIIGAGAQAIAQ